MSCLHCLRTQCNCGAFQNQLNSMQLMQSLPPAPPPLAFEEPQPAKKLYLVVYSESQYQGGHYLRPATAEDLEKLGFVRKGE